ncbi:FAD dependent oxidoreductase [Gyrodon lividus]|nr:FAD dependent oxidoreductase [Gyrodon lividus]
MKATLDRAGHIILPVLILFTLSIATLATECENHRVLSDSPYKPAGLPSTNPTRSFWTHSSPDANPLAREGSEGPLTTDADICIVGSGITGAGVAYHLSGAASSHDVALESQLKVVILEARDFCAGATGRNGGHLTPAAYAKFDNRVSRFGAEEAKRSYALEAHTASSLVDIIENNGWTNDVDLVDGGHINLLFTHEEIKEAERDIDAAKRVGWSLEGLTWLDKGVVKATFGAPYPGVRTPGHNVWPLKLVTKLYQRAKEHVGEHFNLTLHTHTPVTSIVKAPSTHSTMNREYVLSTPRGSVTCSRVVHATNGHVSHLLPFLAGPDGVVPVRGQVLATMASVGPEQIKTNGWGGNEGFEYWFPRPVGDTNENPLIILGGGREAASPDFELYMDDDSICNQKVGETLRAFLPAVFEGRFEQGKDPEMEWTGIMGYTLMGDPFVGPVDKLFQGGAAEYKGQYIAAGYTGHGMPRAFGCAEVIAQMIISELTNKDWKQPEWLPTRYLTWERSRTRT